MYRGTKTAALIVVLSIITLWLSCRRKDTAPEPKAETSGEPSQVSPAPVPVAATPRPYPAREPEFLERLRFRESQHPVVVQGRVARFSVRERAVPPEVWPDEGIVLVTTLLIEVTDKLCGDLAQSTLEASYVGGRTARGSLRTSLMSQDLTPGQEYLFLLTKVQEEFFLVGGRFELLLPAQAAAGRYTDLTSREVTRASIVGACR